LLEQTKTVSLQEFLENTAFQKVKRLVQESAGLNCSGYRDEYLKRRFEIRLRATGANTFGKYIIYLRKNPDEFNNLLNDLTINYTNFFRDSDVYLYLEKVLFPKLFQSKNPVRIWSAGCASGEEPYSLAILIHKILGRTIINHPVTIFASDIDKDALSKASLGNYQQRQLTALDQPLIEQFFTKETDCYRVKDFVKQIIHFEQFDLMKTTAHQSLDLILCRNVMIYFSKEGQQHIHMGFYNALRDGGYFITGKSEILSGEPSKRFVTIDNQTRVYQKPKTNPS
jgi:chemotaxis protein methyltransferase CheR